jgi:hypothetical protein
MNTRLTSEKALTVIDQYLHFRYDGATTNVPYYNNSRKAVRAGLRGALGKGSPRDIFDETDIAMAREKISKSGGNAGMTPSRGAIQGVIAGGSFIPDKLSDSALKHFLVDHTIGIDCSGFVYYVMNAEFSAQNKGSIDRHLTFPPRVYSVNSEQKCVQPRMPMWQHLLMLKIAGQLHSMKRSRETLL